MTSTNSIKYKLLIHMPLWACVLIGVLAWLLFSETMQGTTWLNLCFSYFIVRYFWRKYLNKLGVLNDAGGGLTLMLLSSVLVAASIFNIVRPQAPRLVLYETIVPSVFYKFDSFHERVVTGEEGEIESSKWFWSQPAKSVDEHQFVCAYALKGEYLSACDETSSDWSSRVERVELDLDDATIELLMSDKPAADCLNAPCKVWLTQVTKPEMDEFIVSRLKAAKAKTTPPEAKAKLLGHWENIVTPVRVFNDMSNGWRHVELRDMSGEKVTWKDGF